MAMIGILDYGKANPRRNPASLWPEVGKMIPIETGRKIDASFATIPVYPYPSGKIATAGSKVMWFGDHMPRRCAAWCHDFVVVRDARSGGD
jgi:hypothetical protein